MSVQQLRCNRRRFQAALVSGLFFCATRPTLFARESANDGQADLVEANNAFALEMLRALNANAKGENQFFSPFSIQAALTIAAEGARGETASEMGAALQYPKSLKQNGTQPWNLSSLRTGFRALSARMKPDDGVDANGLRSQLKTLRADLKKANEEVQALARSGKHREAQTKASNASELATRTNQLSMQVDQYELGNANSLWIDNSFKISPAYQTTITDNYRPTVVEAADFRGKSDVERMRINRWVSDQTHDKIRDVIPPGTVDEMTRLVIANATYFKGTWATPFDAASTKTAPFTTSSQQQLNVPLMNMNNFAEGKYAAFNADGTHFETPRMVSDDFKEQEGYPGQGGYQVAELPYNGDKISMMVFLPSDSSGLDTLLSTLTVTQLRTCASKLDQREFHVSLPKFKLESTYDLIPPLKNLGMKQAFNDRTADFTGLTEVRDPDHQHYITAVIHKAFVDVNEQGTEAAAATIVAFAPRSALVTMQPFVPRFNANRPFLFVIRERESGLILFMGKVETPST